MSREDDPREGGDSAAGEAGTGSGADDSDGAPDRESDERAERLDVREERLDQREMGLDSRADQLDERELELDRREEELSERRDDLAETREQLQQREEYIDQRESELDEREQTTRTREQELAERAEELDDKEETLREFVGDNVEEAVSSAMAEYTESRQFGPVGGLVVGLIGLVLVAGGVANAVAAQAGDVPALLGGPTSNLVVSALLVVAGLAVTLGATTGRL
jgi:ribonuclease Y